MKTHEREGSAVKGTRQARKWKDKCGKHSIHFLDSRQKLNKFTADSRIFGGGKKNTTALSFCEITRKKFYCGMRGMAMRGKDSSLLACNGKTVWSLWKPCVCVCWEDAASAFVCCKASFYSLLLTLSTSIPSVTKLMSFCRNPHKKMISCSPYFKKNAKSKKTGFAHASKFFS